MMKFLSMLALAACASAASLTQVTDFGDNTSGTLMYIYVPDAVASDPAIIVAIHYCTGTAEGYYEATPYATLADEYGFIVIYPQSPYSGTCWDVSSTASETHDGGADTSSIANMVTYTLDKYNGDSSKVYVTGSSSGAMMTVSALTILVYKSTVTCAESPRTCSRPHTLMSSPLPPSTLASLLAASGRAPSMAGTRRVLRARSSRRSRTGPRWQRTCTRATQARGPR
jgi:poly(3-hydroxybutyrate) depolymerase